MICPHWIVQRTPLRTVWAATGRSSTPIVQTSAAGDGSPLTQSRATHFAGNLVCRPSTFAPVGLGWSYRARLVGGFVAVGPTWRCVSNWIISVAMGLTPPTIRHACMRVCVYACLDLMASVSVSVGHTVPGWSVGLSLWDQLGGVAPTTLGKSKNSETSNPSLTTVGVTRSCPLL